MVRHPGIDPEADDRQEGSQKESGKAYSQPNQQRLEPAKVAHGNAKDCAFAAGSIDVMRRGHLH